MWPMERAEGGQRRRPRVVVQFEKIHFCRERSDHSGVRLIAAGRGSVRTGFVPKDGSPVRPSLPPRRIPMRKRRLMVAGAVACLALVLVPAGFLVFLASQPSDAERLLARIDYGMTEQEVEEIL